MRHAAVGCLIGLGGWLVLAAAISWLLQRHAGHGFIDTIGVAVLAGLAGWGALNLLFSSFRRWREQVAIDNGIAGVQPTDGAPAVLLGTIQPRGSLLRAPLDDAECVAYDYRVTEDRGQGKRRMVLTHFKGSGLTPSVIVTRTGSHKLLAVPDLEGGEVAAPALDRIAAFRRYAQATVFTGPDTSAQELVNRWTDADGAYRSDVAYARLDELDLLRCQLQQRSIRAGAQVCAFGRYSAARGGIVPSPTWAASPRLIVGDVQQVTATLGSSARTRLLIAVLCALAGAGLVAAFVANA